MPGISAQFSLLTLHLEVAWVYNHKLDYHGLPPNKRQTLK
jgi:hypothetical protein